MNHRGAGVLLVLTLVLAVPLCACYGPEYESVHFHTDRPDFLQMPHPWRGVPAETRAFPRTDQTYGDADQPEGQAARSALLTAKAQRLETEGRFREAADAWSRLPAALREEGAYSDDGEPAPAARGLDDRVAALRAWRGAADTPPLRVYLRARDLVNRNQYGPAEAVLEGLRAEPFRSRSDYLRAAIAFYTGAPDESAARFRRILARHPQDAAARYMIARSYFAGAVAAEEIGAPNDAARRRYLRAALAAYQACAAAPGAGSLGRDAEGMAAACYYRLEEYRPALLRYCRQLAAVPAGGEDDAAFISAQWTLKKMGPADHQAFQQQAVREPGAAAAYLDLLLHYHRLGLQSNYRLGLFALEVLKRHPETQVSSRILARLALIEDRAAHYGRAERLAAAALARAKDAADRDVARWQHALSLRHLGRARDALTEYDRLAAGAVTARMRRGAHEAAAVVCEKLHDYPEALVHYFALEYQLDYGYVADCLASQDDLRAFLRRFPSHPRAKLVRYSLGFRQLRAGEYEAAANTFAPLGPWLEIAEKKFGCQTSKEEPRMPPLQAARFLAAQTRAEAKARAPQERATIAYSTARFIFQQRHLLFYNGALWTGSRTNAFVLQGRYNIDEPDVPVSAEENGKYDRYQHEHAALYQALRVFERIGRDYPNTPEAPKALYSAALCYSFLPSLESYWRDSETEFTKKETALYHRIQREYPDDPLAKDAARWGGPLPAARKAAR